MRTIKVACLAVALAMAVPAMAEGVQISGSVSTGIVFTKMKGDKSKTVAMESAWAGDSLWTISGEHELGNGWKVDFVLENEFASDDGSFEDGIFNSEAMLRVSNGTVGFAFGNLGGTLASGGGEYDLLSGFDPLEAGYGIGGMGLFSTKDMGATNAVAMEYTPTDGVKVVAAMTLEDSDQQSRWAQRDHYYGLGVSYEQEPFAAAAVLEAIDYSKNWEGNGRTADRTAQIASLGASWDFGVVKPMVMLQAARNVKSFAENEAISDLLVRGQAVRFDTKSALIGLSAPVFSGTLAASAQIADIRVKDAAGAGLDSRGRAQVLGISYTYELSKRTSIYTGAVYSHGSRLLAKSNGDVGNDFNQYQFGVGLNHKF